MDSLATLIVACVFNIEWFTSVTSKTRNPKEDVVITICLRLMINEDHPRIGYSETSFTFLDAELPHRQIKHD